MAGQACSPWSFENFPFRFPAQFKPNTRTWGACLDSDVFTQPSILQGWRYSRAGLTWGVAAAAAPLLIAANTNTGVFVAGVGDAGAAQGLPYNLSYGDTDSFSGGAWSDLDQQFVAVGMEALVEMPFVYDQQANAIRRPVWVARYDSTLREMMYENTNVQLSFGNNTTVYNSSPLQFWPQSGGPAGGGLVENGRANAVVYQPFMVPFRTGARSESKKLSGRLVFGGFISPNTTQTPVGAGGEIDSDPMVPTVESVIVPVKLKLWGYPEDCVGLGSSGSQFDVGDQSADKFADMVAEKLAQRAAR